MRATADGRVICGGEDEDFTDETRRDALIGGQVSAGSPTSSASCSRISTPTPEFAWAGSFGTTTTGLPYIGALPRHPRVHAVMGYGGNGITFSQIASEICRPSLLRAGATADADAVCLAAEFVSVTKPPSTDCIAS